MPLSIFQVLPASGKSLTLQWFAKSDAVLQLNSAAWRVLTIQLLTFLWQEDVPKMFTELENTPAWFLFASFSAVVRKYPFRSNFRSIFNTLTFSHSWTYASARRPSLFSNELLVIIKAYQLIIINGNALWMTVLSTALHIDRYFLSLVCFSAYCWLPFTLATPLRKARANNALTVLV